MRRLALLICLLVAVSGCGGDDKEDAEQTVRDFVEASRDATPTATATSW